MKNLSTRINARTVELHENDSKIRELDSRILQATTKSEERRLVALRRQRGRDLAQEAQITS